jgi:hypothetical protein|tara:strand:+ start:279 stop:956 length:678 start_codon:yes stop_codon:yes gene_type:complete
MNRKAYNQFVKVARQPNHNGKYFQKIVKEDEKLFENTLNKIQEPVVRKETINERTQRLVYQYDSPAGMKKPAHMDNPNIIDEENWAQRPKKYSNDDRSTYPSDRDQRQKLDGWDAILKTSKGSKEDMKQIRETLNRAYKTDPSSLTKTELKIIGRGKQPEPLKIDTSGIDQYLQIRKEAEQVLKNQNNFVPKPRREFGGGLTRDFTNQKIIEAEVLYGPEKDKSR